MKNQEETKEAVEVGGWYELLNGKVAQFQWNQGVLEKMLVVENWGEVERIKSSWEDCYQE